jgi:hypothetical protein
LKSIFLIDLTMAVPDPPSAAPPLWHHAVPEKRIGWLEQESAASQQQHPWFIPNEPGRRAPGFADAKPSKIGVWAEPMQRKNPSNQRTYHWSLSNAACLHPASAGKAFNPPTYIVVLAATSSKNYPVMNQMTAGPWP